MPELAEFEKVKKLRARKFSNIPAGVVFQYTESEEIGRVGLNHALRVTQGVPPAVFEKTI